MAMNGLVYMLFKLIPDQLFGRLHETSIPLTGRNFIVTGSNTGIGYALAVHLARLNPAILILAVRDQEKGDAAKAELLKECPRYTGKLEVWVLDMADFGSVKRFADKVNAELTRLDGLVLNAGVQNWKWSLSRDGWEQILQINTIATGLLAVLLLPLILSTVHLPPPSADIPKYTPHITITGSSAHYTARFPEKRSSTILETLNDESKSDIKDRYGTSKLLQLFIARELSKLPHANGVIINVVDPGLCTSVTHLNHDVDVPGLDAFLQFFAWPNSKGSLNLLYGLLTTTPSGCYICKCRIAKPQGWTLTEEAVQVQRKVWQELAEVWKKTAPEAKNIFEVTDNEEVVQTLSE